MPMQNHEFEPYLTPYSKLNTKWIIYLNVRSRTIKLLEETIAINLPDLGLGNGFPVIRPKAQILKGEINRSTSKF